MRGGAKLTMFSERIGRLDGNGQDHAPLYKQLQRALREAIQKKILGPDDALPAERDMAEEFSISRITVRKALDGLVADAGVITVAANLRNLQMHEIPACPAAN